ncbi:nucleotide pyrophosphohydrolase [Geoglobus sp.]
MNLSELTRTVIEFRERRGWKRYHTPKNLAISAAIEVGELLELFQWRSDEEVEDLLKSREYRERLGEEISDVMIYLLTLAHECGIDMERAILSKIEKNERKYPVE